MCGAGTWAPWLQAWVACALGQRLQGRPPTARPVGAQVAEIVCAWACKWVGACLCHAEPSSTHARHVRPAPNRPRNPIQSDPTQDIMVAYVIRTYVDPLERGQDLVVNFINPASK